MSSLTDDRLSQMLRLAAMYGSEHFPPEAYTPHPLINPPPHQHHTTPSGSPLLVLSSLLAVSVCFQSFGMRCANPLRRSGGNVASTYHRPSGASSRSTVSLIMPIFHHWMGRKGSLLMMRLASLMCGQLLVWVRHTFVLSRSAERLNEHMVFQISLLCSRMKLPCTFSRFLICPQSSPVLVCLRRGDV